MGDNYMAGWDDAEDITIDSAFDSTADEVGCETRADGDEPSAGDEGADMFNPILHTHVGECLKCEVSRRFGVKAPCHYSLAFRCVFRDDFESIQNRDVGREGVVRVIDEAFNQCSPEDVVGLEISHPALDAEILTPFTCRELTTVAKVMEVIASVQQSRRILSFNCDMINKATVDTLPPEERGYLKFSDTDFDEFFRNHSTECGGKIFTSLMNEDSSCFFRAVVVAQARTKSLKWRQKDVKWDQIKRGNKYKLQTTMADELMEKAGLSTHHPLQPCGISEIRKVQDVMIGEGFQLKIFSHSHFVASIFDEALEGLEYLYILHRHTQYTPMSTPRILFGKNYYCDLCQHPHNAFPHDCHSEETRS